MNNDTRVREGESWYAPDVSKALDDFSYPIVRQYEPTHHNANGLGYLSTDEIAKGIAMVDRDDHWGYWQPIFGCTADHLSIDRSKRAETV